MTKRNNRPNQTVFCVYYSKSDRKRKINFPMLSIYWEKTQELIRKGQSNKSPGNDGYKKQFYEMIWKLAKETYVGSI